MSGKPPAGELGNSQKSGHGSKFSSKKEAAVALLSQRSMEEAAKTAGIGTQTLYRWLKLPEFQAAYLEARRGNGCPIQRTPATVFERRRFDAVQGYVGP
ncbi:MAG: hypothetical protein ABSB35_09045 [Bryobacteraceae bacterium]|jgi:transposase-like protein